ncbi:MAG TPA: glycosyltransferase family 1 protein [Bryobacteraceae bacterium]|nr:glycosyltransferase family 1 protein [Bryobacteraceae bacterium]
MSRFAKTKRVFFVEEPLFTNDSIPRVDTRMCEESAVTVCVPQLPHDLGPDTMTTIQKLLLNNLISDYGISDYILWYYTPMALDFSRHLTPAITVFDCMDELSAFAGAPREMKEREAEMLKRADIVFTGGQSLYEAKKDRHCDVHCFPSSVDAQHFAKARTVRQDPEDQRHIAHPRLGYCGVIDERMDLTLIEGVAKARPGWQIVMLGPVVKINPYTLPRLPNIHYLGGRKYNELPQYLGGWDVAILPFAHNDSTRFISPTKTPEYLAGGRPVVSTSITDVVRPYGEMKLVRIADTVEDFVKAAEAAMDQDAKSRNWRTTADAMLSQMSWDLTWQKMAWLIADKTAEKKLAARNVGLGAGSRPAVLGD